MICAIIKLMIASMIWWYAKFLTFMQCKFLQVLDDKGCSCYITIALVYTAGVMINSHILDSGKKHQVFFIVSTICYLLHVRITKRLVSLHYIVKSVTFFLLFDRCLTLQDFTSTHVKLGRHNQTQYHGQTGKKWLSWQKTITRSWNSLHKKNAY